MYINIYTYKHIYIYYQAGASPSSVHLHFPTGVASNLSTGDCQRTSSGLTPGSVRVGEESCGEIWLSELVSNPGVNSLCSMFFFAMYCLIYFIFAWWSPSQVLFCWTFGPTRLEFFQLDGTWVPRCHLNNLCHNSYGTRGAPAVPPNPQPDRFPDTYCYCYYYYFYYHYHYYIYIYILYVYIYIICIYINRRKFRSQTSDNMDRWKSKGGKSQRREEKRRRKKIREEKESEERRCRCAKR